ncbi:hypothetical protein [Methylibium sp.]|uniref:hypothetical protein n=1 Tax=Methylibium sp. TaxID=2067992 RepID=UPI003D0B7D10
MHTHAHSSDKTPRLLAVQTPEDIEFLVKESEVLTGQAGRTFVIAGADWLIYRVHWQPLGLKVERLDSQGQVLSIQHLLLWEFLEHHLMEAQAASQLFTPPVRRPG